MGSFKRYQEYSRYLTALEHHILVLGERKLLVEDEYKRSQDAGRIIMQLITSHTKNLKDGNTKVMIARKKAKIQTLKSILQGIVMRKLPRLRKFYFDLMWRLQETQARIQNVIH